MPSTPSLKHIHAAAELSKLEKENKALKSQLDAAVSQLERVRHAKRSKIPVQRPSAKLKGDVIRVVIPDTHGAKADTEALAAVIADVKALQPHEIILLGDHVDCGGFLAQHHTLGYVAESDYSYEDDIEAANTFLDALQAAAPNAKIEYCEGNHEDRVEAFIITTVLRHRKDGEFLRRQFAPEFLLRLADRGISYYRRSICYDGLTVPGVIKRGKCFFLHGFSTSKHAVAAVQMKTAGNVVFGHTHRAQSDIVRRIGVGTVGAFNPGCLTQIQPLWNHANPNDWSLGFGVQLVTHQETFLHLNVPIIEGKSLLTALVNKT
jgi:predicted phosphodiesterase